MMRAGWAITTTYPASEGCGGVFFVVGDEVGLHVFHPVAHAVQLAVRLVCSKHTVTQSVPIRFFCTRTCTNIALYCLYTCTWRTPTAAFWKTVAEYLKFYM